MPIKDPVKLSEYRKQYYVENRDKLLQESKTYQKENRDKFLAARERDRDKNNERKKTRVICECGCEVSRNHLSEHRKTNKHNKKLSESI